MYWWKAPAGRRAGNSRAEDTVPLVTSTSAPRWMKRSIERQQRQRLAEARAMQPDQPSLWTFARGEAQTLVKPRRVFLAFRCAPMQSAPAKGVDSEVASR